MTTRQISVVLRRRLRLSRLAQISLLAGLWMLGQGIAGVARLPVPGAVVGLFLTLALLASGRVRVASVERGARWLLAEMLLFFVPAVLAVMDHRELLGWLGVKILVVILAGTAAVMAATALTIDLCLRLTSHPGWSRHAVE